jgi:cyclopropane-fatty-acyl-phospholipid synthase
LLRRVWRAARRWHQANPIGVAALHARHHCDIDVAIYRLFLDDGLNYLCAFFEDPAHETIEQAQLNKLHRIAAKLDLRPGMAIAEIGSGWGSLAIYLARFTGARVTAINVSPPQISVARERAQAAEVGEQVEFLEVDYRKLAGRFDRVVSIGMMEHVGIGHFGEYFSRIGELLTEDGYALIHCIGRMTPPGTTGPFIRKYIFPGVYTPSLSEVFAATTTTRSSIRATGLPRTARRRSPLPANSSAACGNIISRPCKLASTTVRTWCSSFCCPSGSIRCRLCATS